MQDLHFRHELRQLLEQDDDVKIVEFVLNHVFDQWPRPFFFWLDKKRKQYDIFR